MADYKEIVTKAVISKGKRVFTNSSSVCVENPSNILGCWVINHNFNGYRKDGDIIITGSYDVNVWYSCCDDTKTNVISDTINYNEIVHMRNSSDYDNLDVIVRCLKQPSCVKAYLEDNNICYTIEKELGIELVGDVKVKIEAIDSDDIWDEIVEDDKCSDISNVDENFIKEVII